eukprot:CAMPEP_0176460752 /NCGR_PEP_ID=MMETSP0127-20121128/34193_1 /TAXON_ID=938130 /ORGANISM="Platyophrya macrostoma, Strain WH" /LENGTH=55 /DNA_ID=CAMNT_0017852207 /DNA_START=60 /DNA_END=227 /DNA_ORIENTATION=-
MSTSHIAQEAEALKAKVAEEVNKNALTTKLLELYKQRASGVAQSPTPVATPSPQE